MLPDGSRKAQSRMPYAWSIGCLAAVSVLGQVGKKTGSVEAGLDFAGALAEYRDGTERRYPVADIDGDFTCPACQAQANLDDVEPLI